MNPAGKHAGGGKGGRRKAGGGDDLIKKSYALTTTRQHMLTLRYALQTDDGRDKDVTEPFAAFKTFNRNGIDAVIEFAAGKTLSKAHLKFCKTQFEAHGDALRDCGLSVEDKVNDIKDAAARLLFVRQAVNGEDTPAPLLAFVHFRFTLEVRRWAPDNRSAGQKRARQVPLPLCCFSRHCQTTDSLLVLAPPRASCKRSWRASPCFWSRTVSWRLKHRGGALGGT